MKKGIVENYLRREEKRREGEDLQEMWREKQSIVSLFSAKREPDKTCLISL